MGGRVSGRDGTDQSRSAAVGGGRMRGPGISVRLFFSYVLVLVIAGIVLFLASEAAAPRFIEMHRGPAMHGMQGMGGMSMRVQEQMVELLDSAYRRAMQRALLLGLGVALAVAGGVSLLLSRRLSDPLRSMERASGRIAEGNYGERLDESSPGEVGELAAAFNRMAAELERVEERRRSLVATVAHEFRTPLSSLRGYVEGLQDGAFEAGPETLESCSRQISRLGRLVDDLSLISRVEAGVQEVHPRETRLSTLFIQLEADQGKAFAEKGVRLHVPAARGAAASDDVVFADPDRTVQVLSNIVRNALRHTPPGGEVVVRTAYSTGAEVAGRDPIGTPSATAEATHGEPLGSPGVSPDPPVAELPYVVVEIRDSGEGIAPEAIPHIFERFYRADAARSRSDDDGAGIGLTISRYFVEAQGGRIAAESRSGEGTVVRFSLPRLRRT